MNRSSWLRALGVLLVGVGCLPACAGEDEGAGEEETLGAEGDDDGRSESGLSKSQIQAICGSVTGKAWSADEKAKLPSLVVRKYVDLKKRNDALIEQRGVGAYAGGLTATWLAITGNQKAKAIELIKPKLKGGADPAKVVAEMKGTSCIGNIYEVLKDVYGDLGRGAEWAQIEKCARANSSIGNYLQAALIKNGWQSPTLGFVTDDAKAPGVAGKGGKNHKTHTEFLTAIPSGTYYTVPMSKTVLRNFLPTPGSSTKAENTLFNAIGKQKFVAVGALRAGYHVPFVVPASLIPDEAAPKGAARAAWIAARDRGELFAMESHLKREPWDPTNFEIHPLKELLSQTFQEEIVYSTGTLVFGPGSTYDVP